MEHTVKRWINSCQFHSSLHLAKNAHKTKQIHEILFLPMFDIQFQGFVHVFATKNPAQ